MQSEEIKSWLLNNQKKKEKPQNDVTKYAPVAAMLMPGAFKMYNNGSEMEQYFNPDRHWEAAGYDIEKINKNVIEPKTKDGSGESIVKNRIVPKQHNEIYRKIFEADPEWKNFWIFRGSNENETLKPIDFSETGITNTKTAKLLNYLGKITGDESYRHPSTKLKSGSIPTTQAINAYEMVDNQIRIQESLVAQDKLSSYLLKQLSNLELYNQAHGRQETGVGGWWTPDPTKAYPERSIALGYGDNLHGVPLTKEELMQFFGHHVPHYSDHDLRNFPTPQENPKQQSLLQKYTYNDKGDYGSPIHQYILNERFVEPGSKFWEDVINKKAILLDGDYTSSEELTNIIKNYVQKEFLPKDKQIAQSIVGYLLDAKLEAKRDPDIGSARKFKTIALQDMIEKGLKTEEKNKGQQYRLQDSDYKIKNSKIKNISPKLTADRIANSQRAVLAGIDFLHEYSKSSGYWDKEHVKEVLSEELIKEMADAKAHNKKLPYIDEKYITGLLEKIRQKDGFAKIDLYKDSESKTQRELKRQQMEEYLKYKEETKAYNEKMKIESKKLVNQPLERLGGYAQIAAMTPTIANLVGEISEKGFNSRNIADAFGVFGHGLLGVAAPRTSFGLAPLLSTGIDYLKHINTPENEKDPNFDVRTQAIRNFLAGLPVTGSAVPLLSRMAQDEYKQTGTTGGDARINFDQMKEYLSKKTKDIRTGAYRNKKIR